MHQLKLSFLIEELVLGGRIIRHSVREHVPDDDGQLVSCGAHGRLPSYAESYSPEEIRQVRLTQIADDISSVS